MKNEKCHLIKDLIPLYIDELCSDETNEIIKDHLKECSYCLKTYEDMVSEIKGMDENKNTLEYDRELMKKVSSQVKRKANKTRFVTIGIIALALLIFIFINLPIIPIKASDLTAHTEKASMIDDVVYGYNLEYGNKMSENGIIVYDDKNDKKLEDRTFYEVEFIEYGKSFANDVHIYTDSLNTVEGMCAVEIQSNKPIRGYSYKTDIAGREKVLAVKARTSILGNFQRRAKSSVVFLNEDGSAVKGVYAKEGKSLMRIDE